MNNHDELLSAEYLAVFKLSEGSRALFLLDNPVAYAMAKTWDQEEIDAIYKPDRNGVSVFIRMPDGRLAYNTFENRQVVSNFELSIWRRRSRDSASSITSVGSNIWVRSAK